jgi:dihydrofolate reductase
MSKTILYIATSFDGHVASPNDEVDWMDRYANVEYGYKDFLNGVGAIIMGRRSYDIGVQQGWFSQEDFGSPVFVATSDIPESPSKDGDFTFVSEGIEAAHELAAEKAGTKNVGFSVVPPLPSSMHNQGCLMKYVSGLCRQFWVMENGCLKSWIGA